MAFSNENEKEKAVAAEQNFLCISSPVYLLRRKITTATAATAAPTAAAPSITGHETPLLAEGPRCRSSHRLVLRSGGLGPGPLLHGSVGLGGHAQLLPRRLRLLHRAQLLRHRRPWKGNEKGREKTSRYRAIIEPTQPGRSDRSVVAGQTVHGSVRPPSARSDRLRFWRLCIATKNQTSATDQWGRSDRPYHAGQTANRPGQTGLRPTALELTLSVPNLELMGIALRSRWSWMQRVPSDKPWQGLTIPTLHKEQAFVAASTICHLGDGRTILFWEDSWLREGCIRSIAPSIFEHVPPRIRRRRTVSGALLNRRWIRDIQGALGTQAILDYLKLWSLVQSVDCSTAVSDRLSWKWESSERIDWSILQIVQGPDERERDVPMEHDEMFVLLGLRDEDGRAAEALNAGVVEESTNDL
uniref:Uncharacterized protein n=2 Tax=Oryza sativa subsp. japonica TaxID=39947 RepID=Q10C32_ORYSJ|nr:hypothetical protein [Oryza sativa Japonica Group]AAT76410.1 hypothetical protein [Oryza sativa Japonica Group]ABF99344.1 transposon protein, putative, unclassified [Oryza sativa Japonica Group]